MKTVWVVMVEQHYAGNVDIVAITDTEEKALAIKGESKDRHVYEVELDTEYPLA